eukprot:gene13568-3964_t
MAVAAEKPFVYFVTGNANKLKEVKEIIGHKVDLDNVKLD